MTDKNTRHHWTEDEMRTWACDEALFVHMFPSGAHAGYPSVCGRVVQRPGLSEESGELAPLKDWGNGNKGCALCTDCLDLWWNGPSTQHVKALFADLWTYAETASAPVHLWRTGTVAACGADTGTRVTAPLADIVEDYRTRAVKHLPDVCHTCAVIFDIQAGREEGMDASEGRGWGHAYGSYASDHLHRFWSLDLAGGTTELTYCTPYRVPMFDEVRGTLDEFVDPEVPPCPICLTATEEPGVVVPCTPEEVCTPSTEAERDAVREKAQEVRQAAQKAVQECESPTARELLNWTHELLGKMFEEGHVSQGEYNPSNIFKVHISSYVTNFLNRYREEIATDLEGHADERDAVGDLAVMEGHHGGADRRAATCYRDAARRVRNWPTLEG
jgi:hypothetical protein